MSAVIGAGRPAQGIVRKTLRLAGLSVLLAAAALFAWHGVTKPDAQRYIEDFDESVGRREPAVAAILAADPALRDRMLRETKLAYDEGGWPAATARYQDLKRQLIQVYAGDAPTLACAAAWARIIRNLLPTPALCRAYLLGDYTDGGLRQQMTISDAPCNTAIIDAGRRRAAGVTPDTMSDAEFADAYKRSFDSPTPLSPAEKAAFLDPHADDRLVCQASLKLAENALALPGNGAARYARTQLTARQFALALVDMLPKPPPPAGLTYAAAGTVFTLSMEGHDGKPITWTSLGQNGWDCHMLSSASGRRDLWGGDDRSNPLRLLWPLAVGKTADISGTTSDDVSQTDHYAVTGFDRYWLPFGWVRAYTIEDTVTIGGRVHYTMTHYWSPELGFKIGQRTVVRFGGWPDNTAPDWQVIARK